MNTYTHNAAGEVETAENDQFRWFYLSPDYVTDKADGRSIYLPVGGYPKAGEWGNDPAPAELVTAAREFVDQISGENDRLRAEGRRATAKTHAGAIAVLDSIPVAARAELDARNAAIVAMAGRVNEGGEGYVPIVTWASKAGHEILARNGMDQAQIDAVAAAVRALAD